MFNENMAGVDDSYSYRFNVSVISVGRRTIRSLRFEEATRRDRA